MADDSSSRTTPTATTHSWWRTAALTLVVLLLLGAVLIIFLERKRRVIFPLHDNVATQLVGSLTQKHDIFETRIWERRLYDKLPVALKDWIGTQWKPSGETVGATLPAGSVQFLFAIKPLQRPGQVDKETAFQLAQTEISDRVIGVRLKFGPGWYSSFSRLEPVTDFASTPAISDELLRSTFSDVPHTLEKLHLEVYHTVRGDESSAMQIPFGDYARVSIYNSAHYVHGCRR